MNITAGGGSSNAMPVVDTPLADQAATEDAAFSYTVPVASFSDPEGSALTYNATLTSGGALPVWLSFDPATLTFSGTPDNTAVGTINLRVTATDAQGATVSDDFDLTIANTNDAPTAVTLSAGSAAETLGVGGTVATISGTDDDSIHGDTLTYSIVADPDGKFAIAGNLLQLAAGIDFETATSHNVTIRATDSGGAFFDQAFTVNVTDANEAPGAITDSNAVANNVAENAANATLVGITAHAVDPEGGAITYSLTDNAGGRFAINATTGVVSVANGSLLDYETATSHAITVQASDGSNNTTQNFTVNLTNTNDAPTNILISSGNMDENSTIGTAIGTLSAVDADVGDTHTYSIVSDPDGKFSLAGNTLQVNGLLNHEIKATHNVTIRVSDGTATYDKVLAIGVNDINDAPLYANKTFSLAESATNGTTVGTATAIDEDGDTLTYSITGGNTDNIFAVNASTGVVTIADNSNLNYEATTSYVLSIQASDGSLNDTSFVTVNVTDVNEAPGTISDSNATANSVAENATNGSAVGITAHAVDPEGTAITYSLTDNAGGRFAINGTTGVVTVANGSLLNYEATTSHVITVDASDGANHTSQNFTINLTDVNDAPIVNNQGFTVNENSANGSAVGSVAASDQDSAQTLTYSITAGNADGMFAINASTGAITIADNTNLDYELASSRPITVQVTDNGTGALTDTATVTIGITDINEAPVVNDQSMNVNDTVASGASVGTVAASDPDAGDSLTYAITAGNGAGHFAINTTTGEITTAVAGGTLSGTYALTVQATDTLGGLTDSGAITVTLNEINDPPTINNATFNIDENKPNGSAVGTPTASDPDGNSLQYSITAGNADGIFAINASTGAITIANNSNLDYEHATQYTLTVKATEQGTPDSFFDTAAITVNVNDLNETPTYNDAAFSIAENIANSASVGTVTGTDPDPGDTLTYSITNGNADGIFAINGSTGEITIADNSTIDYETGDTAWSLTIRATDNGTGALHDDATVAITLTNVNEAPVNTVPGAQATNEDTSLAVTGIAVGDVDSINPTVTLGVAHGTLTIRTDVAGGLTAGQVAGNGTGSITISGAAASLINATLADALGLRYVPTTNYNGADTLTVTTSDGSLSDVDTVAVTVTSVNDTPTVATPIDVKSIESDDTWSFQIPVGTFNDVEGDALTYTASWSSDGGTTYGALPAWISFNGTDTFTVPAPPTNSNVNFYRVKITADDGNGGTADHIFTFNVTAVGLTAPDGSGYNMSGTPLTDVITGGGGNDTIEGLASNDTIFGGGGNDRINGDWLSGGTAYSDLIYGGDGNDTIYGESYSWSTGVSAGNDTIYGGNGNDVIYGYNGHNLMYGDDGNDTIYGDLGNDSAYGGNGTDKLWGYAGADTLDGGAGTDTLEGGQGADTMTGGTEADEFAYYALTDSENTLSFDTITDFEEGVDKIRLPIFNNILEGAGMASDRTLEWYQTGSGGTAKTIIRSDGVNFDYYLELTGHHTLSASDFIFFGTVGTNGNDTITGSSGNDAILALGGDDSINAGNGNDQVWGGSGNDTILAGSGDDIIYGEDGNDWIVGNGGSDTLIGGAGDDTISAEASYSTNVSWTGGTGADVFRFDRLGNSHGTLPLALIIEDFEKGTDKLMFDHMPFENFYFGGSDNSTKGHELRVSYNASLDMTSINANISSGSTLGFYLRGDYTTGTNTLDASDFIFDYMTDNDAQDSDPAANIIRDTAGKDGIIGTTGNDVIYTTGGNDEIVAGEGDDVIVKTGSGTPYISPGAGNDVIFLMGGGARVTGGCSGGDTIIGGTDISYGYAYPGNTGDDLFINMRGYIWANNGNDIVYGDRGDANEFYGGNGNDYLNGGEGNERAAGNANDDTLIGGYGQDTLYGGTVGNYTGSGNDTFVFYDPLESETGNVDTILDFNAANDKIVLHGFTGIGAGATEVTITQYNATQYGFPGQNWTDITASNGDIAMTITVKEHITFTAGVNLILNPGTIGTSGADNMTGTAGQDFIFGQKGADTIDGGDGNDSIWGGYDADSVVGGNGNDSLSGGYANDTLRGGAGADTMEGGSGNDTFTFNVGDSDATTTDALWDFKDGNDSDKIDLSDASFDAWGGITYSDLTIQNPVDLGGGYMTRITHGDSGFAIDLVGYYEDGYNISATDFIF